jgi:hypothetical protein
MSCVRRITFYSNKCPAKEQTGLVGRVSFEFIVIGHRFAICESFKSMF